MSEEGVNLHRHIGLAHLSKRATAFAGEGFDVENPAAWNQVRVLVVGAGGLGCELLHCLALSGFTEVEVIDMDTIDLSNLNRQFLFRHADIGKPKSEVAAAFITKRFPYMSVKPHFGKIQDMADDWYRSFHIIIMGLDSISARGWLNRKMASLIEYQRDEETGGIAVASSTPIIDGGTEGFRGSARHIKFGHTACVECSMYLYPPPMQIPMCTLENVPRVPEHCVLYVKEKTWEDHKPFGEQRNPETGKMEASPVDGDNQDHILWIMGEAKKRQEHFKLEGDINFQFTQGVVKNVIPAVGFTNAMVAAMCTNEALKLAIGFSKLLDNYTFYDGGANGVASYAQFMSADPTCEVCQLPQNVTVPRDATPRVLFDAILAHSKAVEVLGANATSAAEALLVATVRSPSGFRGEPTRILAPKSHPQFSLSEQYQSKPVLATLLGAANADSDDSEGAYVDLQVSGGTFRDVTLRFLVFAA